MAVAHSPLSRLYFTGRRVRLTPQASAKLFVPITVLYGLVVKLIELPDTEPRVIVEFEVSNGSVVCAIYAPEDLEALPVTDTQLREDLMERKVHFPPGPSVGICFPSNASDEGVIKGVWWTGVKLCLIVWVCQNGACSDAPFVTPTDFTQCDLVMRTMPTGAR